MNSKQILFSFLALGVMCIMSPGNAFAENISDTVTLEIDVPQAAYVELNPSATTFGLITSTDFNFSTLDSAVTNDPTAHVINFGDPATPDSHVITNDPTTTKDEQYQITLGTSGNTTSAAFSDSAGAAIITVTSPSASVTIFAREYAAGTDVNANEPTLGGIPFAVSGNDLNIAAASNLTYTSNKAGLGMELDLDESSLSEADAPEAGLDFTLTLTVLGIAE